MSDNRSSRRIIRKLPYNFPTMPKIIKMMWSLLTILTTAFQASSKMWFVVALAPTLLLTVLIIFGFGFRSEALAQNVLPGPRANIFGDNAGQFNPTAPFSAFHRWAIMYGPVFRLKIGSQRVVVVNDPTMAKELFEKRGSTYSSRVVPHVSFDLLSQGRRIAFAPSGAMHRTFRKQLQSILSITRSRDHRRIQDLESCQLIRDIFEFSVRQQSVSYKDDSGEVTQAMMRRYTASVMFTLAFGHRLSGVRVEDQGFAKTVFDIMHDNSVAVQPGRYYADIFPWLRRLPYCLRTWEHETEKKLAWQWPFLQRILIQVELQKSRGLANPGLVRALLDQRSGKTTKEQEDLFLDDKSIAYQSLSVVEAGSDTTAISLMNFLLAMAMNPTLVKAGQEAVDAVVPISRLPTFDDMTNLQYIRQLVKETLRWRPPITMGIPHANIHDDNIEGFRIAKNTMVVGNIWAMHQDPTHYTSPENFDPSRYYQSTKSAFESSTEPDAMDRDHYAFGWGHRICPGMHLAENSLLLVVARLLWAFNIEQSVNCDGSRQLLTADPLEDYDNSIIMSPKPFPIVFKVRDKERAAVINSSYSNALQQWEEMGLDIFGDLNKD